MTTAIDIRGVSRRFGRVTALDDVSIAMPEHSLVGLLGRNGAGKTTLMSIIAGQDRASEGRIAVLGHTPFEHGPTLRQIIYVRDNQRYPDDYRLHHVLRIAPAFAPNWDADVADELVDGLRIPAKTPLKKLSRGQLSSVAIVLGLASRAPVTLLDEPYLGLDVTARSLFHTILLREIAAQPRTIVLSTHLIEESASLLDRVVILDHGKVVVDDETEAARDSVVLLSGNTDAVDRVLSGRPVLESHTMGAMTSVTAAGAADDSLRALADELGVQVARATLQDLVSAHGAETPEPLELKKAIRV
ncbi:ABC-2 type transport system ATP-binding protein [Cryobacterium mesophilum]|uniref:ABC transporter ATP-binding protein n=1 Tax=Terrimesophilobacter mesophilus TaxID=433647 RepID=A0A4R8VED1_9MICO|nr:ABC transporter ATP-binding protein [Terrimesophilobacter mesophilus]MBB5633853.1 ABC-2 type transport system ATP-binding protein [Terrimesophilobacter mesophilus]TFB80530.1 ABC transporter ATP-binding protein [Terrimesophilobacter mesophilus]